MTLVVKTPAIFKEDVTFEKSPTVHGDLILDSFEEGDLLVVGANGELTSIPDGLEGQVLTSNGSATPPSWEDPPPTGSPMTHFGEMIVGSYGGTVSVLSPGSEGDVLTSFHNGSAVVPSWEEPAVLSTWCIERKIPTTHISTAMTLQSLWAAPRAGFLVGMAVKADTAGGGESGEEYVTGVTAACHRAYPSSQVGASFPVGDVRNHNTGIWGVTSCVVGSIFYESPMSVGKGDLLGISFTPYGASEGDVGSISGDIYVSFIFRPTANF